MLNWFGNRVRTLVPTVLVLSVLFVIPTSSIAAQATLAWDPNDPTPDGYRIYQRTEGQSFDYNQPVWFGSDNTATVIDLSEDTTHYFVVRAYAGAEESADSSEVSFWSSPPPATTHTIAVSAGQNGSISPGNTVSVDDGADQGFVITPDAGYHLSDVVVDGVSKGAVTAYTFSQVSADHVITASFAIDTYTISASAGVNGGISPKGVVNIDHGGSQSFTITPDAGYHVADVQVDGLSKGSITSYTFNQVSANRSIQATFSNLTYSVPQTAQATLAWDPNDPTPDGYRIYQRTEGQAYDYNQPVWTGSGTTGTIYNLEHDTNFFFVVRAYVGALESADSVEVSFSAQSPLPATHTISIVAGSNGVVSPGNAVSVNTGDSQSFTITPADGYHVADVTVDGTSVGAVQSYTFNQVTANHSLAASFAIDTYTIAANCGDNGTISPAGSASVNYGNSQTYTITPDTGCQVADVLVDGVSLGAASSYTFSQISTNHSIYASFAAETYTLTATAGENGSISPAGSMEITAGGSQTFNFVADSGFHIDDVQVDGQSMGALNQYAFTDLNDNHTVAVTFSESTHVNIWIEAEDGDLQFPMEIADDESAGAGGFIWVPSGTGNLYSPSDSAGYAEYHFEVPEAGDYVVWGHQISNDARSDSFFVSVDGGSEIAWHTKPGDQDVWTWDVVSLRGAGDPRDSSEPERFSFAAGVHTLRIEQREDGTKLDKILITNQTNLIEPEPEPEPDSVVESMEYGQVELEHNWTRIDLEKMFVNPVVVTGPISLNGGHPAVVRIRNVDSSGFEMRIQEWDYLDGSHATETVSYLVMEKGNYILDDGTKIEVATLDSSAAGSFHDIAFNEQFNVAPVVMSTISTYNDSAAVSGRIKNITTDGFEYRMQEQELNAQDHAPEMIGYIAWEPSSGALGEVAFLIGKTANAVKHKVFNINFETPFAVSPAFLADMQTTDGGDTANVRYISKTGVSVDVLIDEEESKDTETNHTSEVVGFMAFSR